VLNSPFLKEIEEMLQEGKSDQYIEDWLDEKGARISRVTINKYKLKHFNVSKEAAKKYNKKESKKRLDNASDKIVSDLEFLDKVKDVASKVKVEVDDDTKPIDIVKVGIQAVKTKNEILKAGEDEKPVQVNIYLDEFDRIMDDGLDDLENPDDIDPED
jgi:hypothetical protein